ncbi:hypothetical protein JTE90_009501 [Oedothorax gibbosus]|uniref:Peptidase aspartic putative domain-containing protein n=1 Tax=Oedothorax gibbosus TaxID=931172 RepID=A0AAV6UUD4_9ARAC|nr:hypothetical protein JTE90_009501 [Oedothorax gibbosus]
MPSNLVTISRKFTDFELQLKAFESFVDSFEADKKDLLNIKLEQFVKLITKYDSIKEEIYSSLSDKDFEAFENKITTCNVLQEDLEVSLKSLISKYITADNNGKVSDNNVKSGVCPRLPELSLPRFNGDIETWFNFKEQFKEIIDNCGLRSKQKLQYLQSCLIGIAKNVQTVDDTYESLFLALEHRFENRRLIINKHVNALLVNDKIRSDSASDLRNLIDKFTNHLRALKLLKVEQNSFSELMLIQMVTQVLDTETKRLFEMTLERADIPTWENFISFLEKRCVFLESLPQSTVKHKQNYKESPRHKNFMLNAEISADKKCKLCSLSHGLWNCETFKNMSIKERFNTVKSLNLCIKSLKANHRVAQCKSKHSCHCKKNHNELLHFNKETNQVTQFSEPPQPDNWHEVANFEPVRFGHPSFSNNQNNTDVNAFGLPGSQNSMVQGQAQGNSGVSMNISALQKCGDNKDIILSTCIIYVENSVGEKIPLRCIADSGSQVALLKASTADCLNLQKTKTNMSVSGLGGSNVNIKSRVKGVISNSTGSYKRLVDFHVVPKITNLMPANSFDISHIVFPQGVQLADPTFNVGNSIDALLSADIFFDILKDGKYKLNNGNLILQNSEFGYLISGNTSGSSSGSLHCGFITNDFENLNATVKSFWEVEEIAPTKFVSEEFKKCDEHFSKTTTRDSTGRFSVDMPTKDRIELGHSKNAALRRLSLLEKRFAREPDLKEKYAAFMDEYRDLGHMERAENASSQAYGACLYVKSESSTETQIRLLCSKTRVAPLKTLSICRLELLAATLLSKLASKIVQLIDMKFDQVHLFSDSKVCS